MKKLLSLALAVILAVCSISLVSAEPVHNAAVKQSVGMDLSGFNTTDLDNNKVTGEIFKNADITFLNLWATWCGPCQDEMPYMKNLYAEYSAIQSPKVQIVSVLYEDPKSTVNEAKSYFQANGYTWLHLRRDAVLMNAFTGGGLPETLIVDSSGIVRGDSVGAFTSQSSMKAYIETWLQIFNHPEEECTVTYKVEGTGEIITTEKIMYGAQLTKYPTPPELPGKKFKSWILGDGSNNVMYAGSDTYIILGNVTFIATYNTVRYKVKFYDGVTDALFNVQQVEYGHAASEPEHPKHDGYTFVGWDVEFNYITQDTEVHGICIANGSDAPATETPAPPATDTPETQVPETEVPETQIPETQAPETQVPETEAPVTDVPETQPPEETPAPQTGIPGDTNGDGFVAVSDALLAMRGVMGLTDLSSDQQALSDMNGDGNVGTDDALYIARVAMGLIH